MLSKAASFNFSKLLSSMNWSVGARLHKFKIPFGLIFDNPPNFIVYNLGNPSTELLGSPFRRLLMPLSLNFEHPVNMTVDNCLQNPSLVKNWSFNSLL